MATPNLDAFELAVARKDAQAAYTEAWRILKGIDEQYGRVDAVEGTSLGAGEERLTRVATRFCAAFGQLITDASIPITPAAYEQLCMHHRWLELLFSMSGFGSADYLVPLLASGPADARRVPPQNLSRFLLLFSAAAGMSMNLDECLAADAPAAISAFLGYLGTRFAFTDQGSAFRERLLEWLPGRMSGVKLGDIALQAIASPYMHCSYASGPHKHAIKADIMAQMRAGCLGAGCREYDPARFKPTAPKPTVVVSTEHFNEGHSVQRTHSRVVAALRSRFRVVGLLHQQHATAGVISSFDETIAYPRDATFLELMKTLVGQVLAQRPSMVLHLGVGMSPYVIGLASLRLAPVQAVSFGHTATTRSPAIDAFILPDDFVGDPACFSERLVRLPAEAMPYAPRADVDYAAIAAAAAAERALALEGPSKIAIPASVMKLTPPFFDALARVSAASPRPVEFHIFPLGCMGLGYAELRKRLAARLPSAVVHPELPYDDYMRRLAASDFFVCPFPYGNMNSILDAVLVGLPGVCLDGPEAHAHADVAYFRRMRFPAALAAASLEAYEAAIVRLANDAKWLARQCKMAKGVDLAAAFFDGDAGLFVDAVAQLIAETHAGAGPELERAV
jgi:hypothetical protein